jgi:nitrite reductase (NADH) small subunit/3-phenylpropionate/trans-cinnamate dioxygenase ferredoxin subunit
MSQFVTVARVGDIPPGQSTTVQVGDQLVAVFNIGGRYYAINDLCPHMGASLAAGVVDQGVVTCPWHAWRFRVSDGTWCDNPRLKVACYEVRQQGDEIQIRLSPNGQTREAT